MQESVCTLLSPTKIPCNSPPSGHFGNQCKKSTEFVLQDARESCRPTGMLVSSPVEPQRADIPYALVSQVLVVMLAKISLQSCLSAVTHRHVFSYGIFIDSTYLVRLPSLEQELRKSGPSGSVQF